MREIKEIKERAREFGAPGCGFIHSEMRNGDFVETILNGEATAIMWQVCSIIDRLAKLSDSDFMEIGCLILGMPQHGGYTAISHATEEPDWLATMAQRMDAVQKSKDDKAEAAPETVPIKEYERDVAMLKSKLTEAELRMDTQREVHKAQLKAKDATIKSLNKEILKLEHELRDMEERQLRIRGAGGYEN